MWARGIAVLALVSGTFVQGTTSVCFADLVAHGIYAPGSTLPPEVLITRGDFTLAGNTPGKWGPAADGTGATVTYSFITGGTTYNCNIPNVEPVGCTAVALDTFMPIGFKAEIVRAFDAWSAVADITFVEVADNALDFNAAGATGDIRIAGHIEDGPSGSLAHAYFPPVNGTSAAGDMHFDTQELWKIGFGGPGFDIFQVAAHEIGHAIGLDHATTGGLALMDPFYTEAFSGLQPDDIAGAQFIYGPATAVPEPSAFAFLAICCLTGAVRRWRKR